MSKNNKSKDKKGILKTIVVIDLTLVLIFALFKLIFLERIYPGVKITDINVGGKKIEEVINLIKLDKEPSEVNLVYLNQNFKIALPSINFAYDYPKTVNYALKIGRSGNISYDTAQIIKNFYQGPNLGLQINLDETKLSSFLQNAAEEISEEPVLPLVKINNGYILVDKGKPGKVVDLQKLRIDIGQSLSFASANPIKIKTRESDPSLVESEIKQAKIRGEKLINKSLTAYLEDKKFIYKDTELVSLLNPKSDYYPDKISEIVANLSQNLDRESQDPVFKFLTNPSGQKDGGRVTEFLPAKEGLTTKKEELAKLLADSLNSLENGNEKNLSFEVPVIKTPNKRKTSDVNNLGIKELLGRGSSKFFHSIPSRVHNIALATSRINGILISPGETFSFNEALGDVSKFTGYKEAYVIRDGKTILGDGGGVCQVSSTLFRAALKAGLPIIERRAHSYRVGYYEQDSPPGFDATVYDPTSDLKIKNDTPNHILIQAAADTKNLTLNFELYGTKDQRISFTSKPVVSNRVPAPDDLYVDDPSLPAGKFKQIDYKAEGSKVTFDYVVKKGDEIIIQKTFVSNYHPWQAIFLRGIGQ